MIEPWNDPMILPPPVRTCEVTHFKILDFKLLQITLENTLRLLSQQTPLHQESAILSRTLYKYDKKFRSDIGYRNLKKVNTALKKYLGLNFLKDVEDFLVTLPSDNNDKHLPTRQMLEYLLVRLLTFCKLMVRICVTTRQSAVFYLDRVKRGESHWMSFIPYALLCRLWSMSKVLLEHGCNTYDTLFPFCEKLITKGMSFLPKGYKLPLDLREWLDINYLDNFGRFNWKLSKSVHEGNIFEDNDGDEFDALLEYVNIINDKSNVEEDSLSNNLYVKNTSDIILENEKKDEDFGQVISRDIFQKLCSVNKDSYNHRVENVTNKFSLKKFIDTEEQLRNNESKEALTSHLSFMQWQALKNALVKLQESLSTNRKIERKFSKIWKEKCLEYI